MPLKRDSLIKMLEQLTEEFPRKKDKIIIRENQPQSSHVISAFWVENLQYFLRAAIIRKNNVRTHIILKIFLIWIYYFSRLKAVYRQT